MTAVSSGGSLRVGHERPWRAWINVLHQPSIALEWTARWSRPAFRTNVSRRRCRVGTCFSVVVSSDQEMSAAATRDPDATREYASAADFPGTILASIDATVATGSLRFRIRVMERAPYRGVLAGHVRVRRGLRCPATALACAPPARAPLHLPILYELSRPVDRFRSNRSVFALQFNQPRIHCGQVPKPGMIRTDCIVDRGRKTARTYQIAQLLQLRSLERERDLLPCHGYMLVRLPLGASSSIECTRDETSLRLQRNQRIEARRPPRGQPTRQPRDGQ
jgi:hypothetical protein